MEDFNTVSVSLVVQSHLNDIQHMMFVQDADVQKLMALKLKFVRHLLFKHKDQTTEINPDAEWDRIIGE